MTDIRLESLGAKIVFVFCLTMKLLKTRKQNNPIFFQPIQSNSLFDWNLWIYDKIIWFVSIKINQSKTTTTILIMITNQQEPRGKKRYFFAIEFFFFGGKIYRRYMTSVCVFVYVSRKKSTDDELSLTMKIFCLFFVEWQKTKFA